MSTTNESLKAAFEALKSYGAGTSRGALQLIDLAVADASRDLKSAPVRQLERLLISALKEARFAPGQEYAASKLRLVGSEASVPALAGLLSDPRLAGSARNALEGISHPAANRALRQGLPQLHGPQKIGAIHSLGSKRDIDAVQDLTSLLNADDAQVASAAAYALGEIGTPGAAKPLIARLATAGEALKPALYDAGLTCAELLGREGHKGEAKALRQALGGNGAPKHVRDAAFKAGVGAA
jgi:HEAT repeat protein